MAVSAPAARLSARSLGPLGKALSVFREVASRPAGAFGLAVVGGLLVVVAFAPLVAPYDYSHQDIVHRLEGPSWSHLFGTDQLGRDLLSRLMFGARVALGVSVPAVTGALVVGLVLGVVGGYVGGWVDNAMIVIMDTLQAFPAVILALALLALLGASLRNVIVVIVVAFAPNYARVARALVLAVKQNPYVEAERSLGASDPRIVFVHILPNILAPLFILLAMDIPSAITVEAGLSFLGLGVQPPTPSWGVILQDGFQRVFQDYWPILWAGVALMVTTLGFTFLGETLRDVVDPKLAGLRRWRRP